MGECLVPCRFIPEGLQCSCGPDWYTVGTKYRSEYYTWFLFIFCFIVPLSLICFSYTQLLGALRVVSDLCEAQGGGGRGLQDGREEWVSASEHKTSGGIWLAQSEEHTIPDLGVVSSRPTSGVDYLTNLKKERTFDIWKCSQPGRGDTRKQ